MCVFCGCGSSSDSLSTHHSYDGLHVHSHDHSSIGATHVHGMASERVLQIEQNLLEENDQYAQINRRRLAEKGIFAVNLVSSPGSGKTSLLVETVKRWHEKGSVAVIEGDQQTSNDAERIRETGVPAIQINTGKGCHLDAHMVGHAIDHLETEKALKNNSLLLIENVGNLVCPAAFDLGEAHKVIILSVTEGEDKPLKYPDLFRAANVMILGKIDLLPHVDFDVDMAIRYARQVHPDIHIISLSTRDGTGFQEWIDWLENGCVKVQLSRG